jgi:AraC-like DNA-binding protein
MGYSDVMARTAYDGRRPRPDLEVRAGEGVTVLVHECTKPRGGWSPPEVLDCYGLVFVHRGGFMRRLDGRDDFVGPSMAFFEGPGAELQVRHPLEQGDTTTMLFLSEPAVIRLTGDAELPTRPILAPAWINLEHRRLITALRAFGGCFHDQERLASLVGALVEEVAPGRLTTGRPAAPRAHRRIVNLAREMITADPAGSDLRAVSDAAGHSAFHVSRVFRRHAGVSLTRFRNQVRVAGVLDRLDQGDTDLAALAASLGFADQAHMTRVVRAEIGSPPGLVRRILSARSDR